MAVDKVFKDKKQDVGDFKFDKNVVSVFDDMVVRSVPFYLEMQRMITELSNDFAQQDTNLYDLGCSTGTTLMNLDASLDKSIGFVGVDESEEMIKKCRKNLISSGITRKFDLINANLNNGVDLDNPSVVIFCLTLQFIRPLYRINLIKSIYEQLPENGALIIVEKVLGEDSLFNRLFIKYYYDFKRRNEYSEIEISKKREALENVLIPYKLKENEEMLTGVGFKSVDVFFKWYNFTGIVAVK